MLTRENLMRNLMRFCRTTPHRVEGCCLTWARQGLGGEVGRAAREHRRGLLA